jgi:prevent-host-death family protein
LWYNGPSVSQVKAALSEYLNRAAYGRERIVISSRGKPKAAMIGIDDLRRLEELEDALAAVEALEAHESGETVPWDQIKAELTGGNGDVSD